MLCVASSRVLARLKSSLAFLRHLVQHLSRRIKKLQARCAIGADFQHDSVAALWVFQDQGRRAVGVAPEEQSGLRLRPALQEIPQRCLLLLFGQIAILFYQLHKRLKRVIRLIHDADERTLALFVLISFDDHDLILLVVIKAKMAMAGNLAILPFAPAPDKTPVLRAFIIVEDHPCYLAAVRMWILLAPEDRARSARRIRDSHSHSAIRFHDVYSLHIDLVKRLFTQSRLLRAQKNRRHKNRDQYPRINDKKALPVC